MITLYMTIIYSKMKKVTMVFTFLTGIWTTPIYNLLMPQIGK